MPVTGPGELKGGLREEIGAPKFLVPLVKKIFCSLALGDVGYGDDSSRDFSVFNNWKRGVLDGDRSPVAPPHDFRVHAATFALAERAVDRAFIHRVGRAVRLMMMHQLMHIPS